MARKYNVLKTRALTVFENRGWLSPPAWAVLASFYPVRAGYSYLKRLHRWKLLDRTIDRRGLLLYRINPRGRKRLEWLREVRFQEPRSKQAPRNDLPINRNSS